MLATLVASSSCLEAKLDYAAEFLELAENGGDAVIGSVTWHGATCHQEGFQPTCDDQSDLNRVELTIDWAPTNARVPLDAPIWGVRHFPAGVPRAGVIALRATRPPIDDFVCDGELVDDSWLMMVSVTNPPPISEDELKRYIEEGIDAATETPVQDKLPGCTIPPPPDG